jgi:hypothetical protein
MKNSRTISKLAGAALFASTLLAVTAANQTKVSAAVNETPYNSVVTVKYNGRGKIKLLNSNGHYVNQYVSKNSKWKTFSKATINGQTMYRIGNQSQWLPSQYTNAPSASTSHKSGSAATSSAVTIKYVPGYSIAVWSSPNSHRQYVGKKLKHGTSWKVFKKAVGSDGYVWFNLGGNQWISSYYTNRTMFSGNNTNQNNSSVNRPTNRPNTGNQNRNNSGSNVATNPGNNSHNSSSNQSNNNSQNSNTGSHLKEEELSEAKIEELLMQKIQALRTSTYRGENTSGSNRDRKKVNGLCKPYMTDPEIQRLADLRNEEIQVRYDHIRPNGHRMDVNEYESLLPGLVSQTHKVGFVSAGEDCAIIPVQGLTNEDTAKIAFDAFTGDMGHKQVLQSSLDRDAYAAVSVKLINGQTSVVFEEAAID